MKTEMSYLVFVINPILPFNTKIMLTRWFSFCFLWHKG